MQVLVEWENANQLDIQTILEMAEDGYVFGIGDGRIQRVLIRMKIH